jgi:hypothetical protein
MDAMTITLFVANTETDTIAVSLPQVKRTDWALASSGWNPTSKQYEAEYVMNAIDPLYPASFSISQGVEKSMQRRTSLYMASRALTMDGTNVLANDLVDVRITMRTPGAFGLSEIAGVQRLLANLFSATFVTAPSGVMDATVFNKLANGNLRWE